MGIPIFYSALLLTCVNLVLRLVGTSFQVYLSGVIGAEGIGLLQLTLSVGSLALVAGTAGVRTASMYLTAEELGRHRPENLHWVLAGCFRYSIAVSIVIALGLVYFAPDLAAHWIGSTQATAALGLLGAFLPLSCLCGVMTGYFTAANRIGTLAAVELAEQAAAMTVTTLLLTFWAEGDMGRSCCCVVLGSGLGTALTTLALVLLRSLGRPKAGPPIAMGRRLLTAAVPLGIADAAKSGITTLENLMVPRRLARHRATANPLASFGLVSGMVFPVLMFPACILYALAELLLPELARCAAAGRNLRIRYLVRRCLKVTLLYGSLCFGLEFLLASYLGEALYGSLPAGAMLRLYAPMIPMLYCDAIVDAMTKGLGQQRACVRYNIFTAALDVIFLFVLLPRYGMRGYCLSFFVTHLLNFLLSLGRLLKITQVTIPLQVPLLTLVGTLSAVWGASRFSSPLSAVFVFLCLWVCLLVLGGIVGREDIRWLKGLVLGKRPRQSQTAPGKQ